MQTDRPTRSLAEIPFSERLAIIRSGQVPEPVIAEIIDADPLFRAYWAREAEAKRLGR